jgi:hypothetical protein
MFFYIKKLILNIMYKKVFIIQEIVFYIIYINNTLKNIL